MVMLLYFGLVGLQKHTVGLAFELNYNHGYIIMILHTDIAE